MQSLIHEIAAHARPLAKDGKVASSALEQKSIYYGVIKYETLTKEASDKIDAVPEVKEAKAGSGQKALGSMAMFPAIMLIAYIALFLYFKSRGGYKAEVLTGHGAEDEKFTGGVEGGGSA